MPEEELEDILEKHDLILLDACFLHHNRSNYTDTLYQDKFGLQLNDLAEQIFLDHQTWQSKNDLILSSKKVFTVSLVVQELDNFL